MMTGGKVRDVSYLRKGGEIYFHAKEFGEYLRDCLDTNKPVENLLQILECLENPDSLPDAK